MMLNLDRIVGAFAVHRFDMMIDPLGVNESSCHYYVAWLAKICLNILGNFAVLRSGVLL